MGFIVNNRRRSSLNLSIFDSSKCYLLQKRLICHEKQICEFHHKKGVKRCYTMWNLNQIAIWTPNNIRNMLIWRHLIMTSIQQLNSSWNKLPISTCFVQLLSHYKQKHAQINSKLTLMNQITTDFAISHWFRACLRKQKWL